MLINLNNWVTWDLQAYASSYMNVSFTTRVGEEFNHKTSG